MAKAGLHAAGAVMALCAVLLLTVAFHWFQVFLLLIGLGTMGGGLVDSKAAVAQPASRDQDLRSRLAELDGFLAEGMLKPAEHKRKRQQLIDDWGRPPPLA